MSAKCRECGHDVTFHATPSQGRTRIPCGYPSCDCQDFVELHRLPLQPGERVLVEAVVERVFDVMNGQVPEGWAHVKIGGHSYGIPLSAIRRMEGK